MENLFKNNFVSHYNLPTSTVTDFIIETSSTYFEIEDTNAGDIVVHMTRDSGMARFSNPDNLTFSIVMYEKFITNVADHAFKYGRKRCDIVMSSRSERYFVLGELKNRIHESKVRKCAKEQLISSVQTLLEVSEIKECIDSKAIKRCCYFNKQSKSPSLINATSAFNRLSGIYHDGFKMNFPDLEKLGFEFFEYTGMQTMVLTI